MNLLINIISALVFIFLLFSVFYLKKKGLLQDTSTSAQKPYSFARVQTVWWTIIIIGSFLYIFALGQYYNPDFSLNILNPTSLILLGISAGTLGIGRIIDSGQESRVLNRHQDSPSEGFIIDILSDENGICIHRFQGLFFNIIYGLIFIYIVLVSQKMPDFSELDLTLMGISSAMYIGLKTTENNSRNEAKG